ncbi:NAD-dependent epimerase/dehydratase family protein [Mesorhizobium xinjiangense]|uniref:NAD-dependent epimerase/dehydratase family protein n=1 Tax=Mesorhizobium xinjiangense TaxID=2678685 RepID=UPI0012EDB39B|nr:NAD(P)-dependent oxidoreductase [Mesorhizobium xinjiangense]
MKALVSGGTGIVGRFIVEALLGAGHAVAVMGRRPPEPGFFSRPVAFVEGRLDADRDQAAAFAGVDGFVHAAFDHEPGKYRGGEGDDPATFRRRNLAGTMALFTAAKRAGVGRAVFLSSRAVYGRQAPGALLVEEMTPHPDTLYGEVKLEAEQGLAALCDAAFAGCSLRVTGVYGPAGPGRAHKWSGLFEDYLAGRHIAPRVATEVHGDDVAAAVLLALETEAGAVSGKVFNVSDLALDRHDLLALVRDAAGATHPLPARADRAALNVMATERLRALGWQPGGQALLERTVRAMVGRG